MVNYLTTQINLNYDNNCSYYSLSRDGIFNEYFKSVDMMIYQQSNFGKLLYSKSNNLNSNLQYDKLYLLAVEKNDYNIERLSSYGLQKLNYNYNSSIDLNLRKCDCIDYYIKSAHDSFIFYKNYDNSNHVITMLFTDLFKFNTYLHKIKIKSYVQSDEQLGLILKYN